MSIEFDEPIRDLGQSDVLELACEPLENVRIAFVGLGKRGKEAIQNFFYFENVEIVAICDLKFENVSLVQELFHSHNKKCAAVYTQPDDWRKVCERSDVDLIYVCTDRTLHTPIAVYAMQQGKHVALEVPAANTIEECWLLVDTAEKYRRHCMMLENCCYDASTMAVLNMAKQGLFGEIFHAEGGYIHDLKQINFDQRDHYLDFWTMCGNPYPTHGLGPLCQLLDIHRGDKLEWLTSVSSGQFNSPVSDDSDLRKECSLGNMNTTIIRTKKAKTIVLQHDISSPRPYSRNYLISGTKGFVQQRETPRIAILPDANEFISEQDTEKLLKQYEHPFFKETGELARRVGTHGGMNFIMDYRLVHCLKNGLPLDMDVYDAAEWSAVIELSAQSVTNNSTPVRFPDFTRGSTQK